MLVKIVALVVPVGLDAFGVSAALAVAGLAHEQRLRIWLLLTASETAMPVVGILVGRPLAAIGTTVNYVAAAILLVFAVRMLRGEEEAPGAPLLAQHGALTAAILALSVGLDELAIGLELGVLHAPPGPVIAAVVAQALLISLLGLRVGDRVSDRVREGSERAAGAILALVALVLLIEAILGG